MIEAESQKMPLKRLNILTSICNPWIWYAHLYELKTYTQNYIFWSFTLKTSKEHRKRWSAIETTIINVVIFECPWLTLEESMPKLKRIIALKGDTCSRNFANEFINEQEFYATLIKGVHWHGNFSALKNIICIVSFNCHLLHQALSE